MSTGTQISIAREFLNRCFYGSRILRRIDVGDEERSVFAWELLSGDESLGTYSDYTKAMEAMKEMQCTN